MTRIKKVDYVKVELPDAAKSFKKIKLMRESLNRRMERDYNPDSDVMVFWNYTDRGLKSMMEMERHNWRAFWQERLSDPYNRDGVKLFDEGYYWLSEHDGIAIGNGKEKEPYYPSEAAVDLMVILSGNHYALDFWENELIKLQFRGINFEKGGPPHTGFEYANLVNVLDSSRLWMLMDALESHQISDLIHGVYDTELCKPRKERNLVEKLAKEIEGCNATGKLREHVIVNADSGLIAILNESGEKSKEIAEQLKEHMKKILKRINEAVGSLEREP